MLSGPGGATIQGAGTRSSHPVTPQMQLDVLLHEYAAREAELLGVLTGFQDVMNNAVLVVAGAIGIALQTGKPDIVAVLPTAILLFLSLEIDRGWRIEYHRTYLTVLEERINRFAGERLLVWSHAGGYHRTILGRSELQHPRTKRRVRNYNRWIEYAYALGFATLGLCGMVVACGWILALTLGSLATRIVLCTAYVLLHVGFFLLMVTRYRKQPEQLALIREQLEIEMDVP